MDVYVLCVVCVCATSGQLVLFSMTVLPCSVDISKSHYIHKIFNVHLNFVTCYSFRNRPILRDENFKTGHVGMVYSFSG